ncbi:MAG: hypothetical protein LH471_05360, partial [Salinibacterium sp.]|nr:hypothetical protein [Salinibacterium sp.]
MAPEPEFERHVERLMLSLLALSRLSPQTVRSPAMEPKQGWGPKPGWRPRSGSAPTPRLRDLPHWLGFRLTECPRHSLQR